ncbi:MAG: hypothetical protein HKN38_10445, partial [Altererythrobacter sp.]|nr:hypothetical protein [Altererythrobacter sp.]
FDFLEIVEPDEEYYTVKRKHDALRSGLIDHVQFGRNEGGGQVFHQWADKLTQASDDELIEIFAAEQRQAAE